LSTEALIKMTIKHHTPLPNILALIILMIGLLAFYLSPQFFSFRAASYPQHKSVSLLSLRFPSSTPYEHHFDSSRSISAQEIGQVIMLGMVYHSPTISK